MYINGYQHRSYNPCSNMRMRGKTKGKKEKKRKKKMQRKKKKEKMLSKEGMVMRGLLFIPPISLKESVVPCIFC